VISTGVDRHHSGGNGDDAIQCGHVDNLTDVVFGDNAKITLNKPAVTGLRLLIHPVRKFA